MSSSNTDEIVIPHKSLNEAISTAAKLGAVFGKDCFLLPGNYSLRIPLNFIDARIEAEMKQADTLPNSSPLTPLFSLILPSPHPPFLPTPLDRTLTLTPDQQLTLLQIEAQFVSEWTDAEGNSYQEKLARRSQLQAKKRLRAEILAPLVQAEIIPGQTLIYTDRKFDQAICQPAPDGRAYTLKTLIHLTLPVSAEDRYLRECRVTCDRIIRYNIPELDGGLWLKQDQPRQTLDAEQWRKLLLERAIS